MRLHILTRSGLDKALVIRRGPTKVVGFIGFDFKTQQCKEGQWLKGRIYSRRCDLSPDGNYIAIYICKKYSLGVVNLLLVNLLIRIR